MRKAHLQERLDEILGQMNPTWEVPLAFAYLEAAAAENKTGQVMLGRQVSLLQALLKVKQDLDLDAYRYGLEAAVAKGAANPNYVKRAAASHSRHAVEGPTVRRTRPAERYEFHDGEV
ncbi:MAG: hypothetical protein ACYC63_11035 [Armatimonadota bacterium]